MGLSRSSPELGRDGDSGRVLANSATGRLQLFRETLPDPGYWGSASSI